MRRGEREICATQTTNQFCCGPAFFCGYLLRGALNLRNYSIHIPIQSKTEKIAPQFVIQILVDS